MNDKATVIGGVFYKMQNSRQMGVKNTIFPDRIGGLHRVKAWKTKAEKSKSTKALQENDQNRNTAQKTREGTAECTHLFFLT